MGSNHSSSSSKKKSPKNIANSLLCGTEIQCFNAVRAQHSDLDIAGRETTLQKDRYTVVFHPWRGLCPPCSQHCGNCCCPNAHTHQPFKPRFCCLGTPWPLGDQKMTVCATKLVSCLPLLYAVPTFRSFLLSPCSLSLSPISLQQHNVHHHLPSLQIQAEDAPLGLE